VRRLPPAGLSEHPVRHRRGPAARRQASMPPGAGQGQRQVHRFSSGTLARTWAACAPQPAQVIFLQRSQTTGLHMRVLRFCRDTRYLGSDIGCTPQATRLGRPPVATMGSPARAPACIPPASLKTSRPSRPSSAAARAGRRSGTRSPPRGPSAARPPAAEPGRAGSGVPGGVTRLPGTRLPDTGQERAAVGESGRLRGRHLFRRLAEELPSALTSRHGIVPAGRPAEPPWLVPDRHLRAAAAWW